MNHLDSTFIKLDDDETCALLKPHTPTNRPPVSHIANEILNIFHQYPEIRKRVIARLGNVGKLTLE